MQRDRAAGRSRIERVAVYNLKQRCMLALVPPLAAMVLRLLGRTLRYEDLAAPGTPPGYLLAAPTIYAFWHRSLLAGAYRFRNLGVAILISRSFDGELVARTVERMGFVVVRGSSSFGGASGLRQLAEIYERGQHCGFTADGPRGPAMVAKAGAVQLAALVKAPWVGTFYALPQRAWTLRSWDGFLIPKPFSRVLMTWPEHVVEGALDVAHLQAALDRSVAMAELFGAEREAAGQGAAR